MLRQLAVAAHDGNMGRVVECLNQGMDVNAGVYLDDSELTNVPQSEISLMTSGFGTTALELACAAGHDAVVKLLLSHGARITHHALKYAIVGQHVNALRVLLQSGAEKRLNDYRWDVVNDSSFLVYGIKTKNVEIVKLLLIAGADVTTDDISYSIYCRMPEMFRILSTLRDPSKELYSLVRSSTYSLDELRPFLVVLNLKAYPFLVGGAVEKRDMELLKFLLSQGVPADEPDRDGVTPLMQAVIQNQKVMAELLLKAGADPKYQNTVVDCEHDDYLEGPLSLAEWQQPSMLPLLRQFIKR